MSERQQTAGWFPDPDGPQQLRYFDGVQWTEHRSPNPAVQHRLPPTPESRRVTHLARVGVAVLALLVAVGVTVGLVVSQGPSAATKKRDHDSAACYAALSRYMDEGHILSMEEQGAYYQVCVNYLALQP